MKGRCVFIIIYQRIPQIMSLGVYTSSVHSNEHDAKHGVRSGPEQPLAPEHCDKPGASPFQQKTEENSEVM